MANNNNLPAIRNMIQSDAMQRSIQARLGEKAGTFTTSLLDVIGGNGQLQKCDPKLVVKEALKAAALDLPINSNLGFAYLIPYNESININGQWSKQLMPHFQMGYKGFIQLALRTGQYKHLNADAIYEGESFIVDRIRGTLEIGGEATSDKAIGYFCYMELINGFQKAIAWTREKVYNHAKLYSKSFSYYLEGKTKTKPIWETDFDGMALKTMIIQLVPKYGPMTIEMSTALASDRGDFKGFDSRVSEEITDNANSEIIDIPADEEPQEGDGISDAEKAEILAEEAAQSEDSVKVDPGF